MEFLNDFDISIDLLSIEKRDYQIAAVKEIIEILPEKSILLNYPYGTGKTIIALLAFLAIKKVKPEAKFVFTSAREAAALRCRQALDMAKKFGFIEELGYLYDPRGKGLSLRQKHKMYEASSVIFAPITTIMKDRFEMRSKLKDDILKSIDLCVIDEATDLLARDMTGFRLSKYFDTLFHIRKQGNMFPILAMTGTRDKQKAKAIKKMLDENTHMMQRLDLSPYETITKMHQIKREDYIKIDNLLSSLLSKPVEAIQKLLDSKLSRLEIIKLSYGGIVERLQTAKNEYPVRVGRFQIKDKETKDELINAFFRLFKFAHSRLLLLESTPNEFLKYIEIEENKEFFKDVIEASKEMISYRIDLPLYDNPSETITRAFIQPKVYTAVEIIYNHLVKGAQILLFTRYLALGEQIYRLLRKLNFPNVRYLSGKTPEDLRRITLKEFEEGNAEILIFTPVGGRGLNLDAADVVIHLDITTNIDDMIQRRERARGCLEYVLVLQETSEERKVEDYGKLIESLNNKETEN